MTRSQMNAYMEKHWGTLVAVIIALLTSMGFQWGGPGQRLSRVESRVDTLSVSLQQLTDSTEYSLKELLRGQRLLFIARCAETKNPVVREVLECR